MKSKFGFLFLILSLFSQTSFAQHGEHQTHEGGHTGNGGGVVNCPGLPPMILDFFEIPGEREDVLDLDAMPRAEFVELMKARVAQGADSTPYFTTPWWVNSNRTPLPVLSTAVSYFLYGQGPVDQWKKTAAWPVRDEGIADNLPAGCSFEQAAISRDHIPHRIKAVTDLLTEAQKRILELHEALFVYADYYSMFAYNGTSASVRKLVRTLIRKNPSAAELKAAFEEFSVAAKSPSAQGALYAQTGLYVLDLRGEGEAQKAAQKADCATWLGIVPTIDQDAYLYLMNDQNGSIEELLMPHESRNLLQKAISVRSGSDFYERKSVRRDSGETSALQMSFQSFGDNLPGVFFSENGGTRCAYSRIDHADAFVAQSIMADSSAIRSRTHAVKNMIEYLETKKRGMSSPYGVEASELLSRYGH